MLRVHSEGPIESGGRVLPGDHFGEFDDFFGTELRGDSSEQRVIHISHGHGVGVVQRGQLSAVEPVSIERHDDNRIEFGLTEPLGAADRSVDVLSEHAADSSRHATIDQ